MNKVIVPQSSKSTPFPANYNTSKSATATTIPVRPPLFPTPQSYPTSSSGDKERTSQRAATTTTTHVPATIAKKPGGVQPLNILRESRLHQIFKSRSTAHSNNNIRSRGLKVGYAIYGPHNGIPVFVIGGYGCTRLVGIMFEELANRYGLKLIWPERPGYGLSDECSSQRFKPLDWADTVLQLANELQIKQFCIIAQSVGSVFALAIAYKYPQRVLGPVYLISPWVSTQAANTFKWTRRLPSPIVHKTISLALDVMWIWNKNGNNHSNNSRHAHSQSASTNHNGSPSYTLDYYNNHPSKTTATSANSAINNDSYKSYHYSHKQRVLIKPSSPPSSSTSSSSSSTMSTAQPPHLQRRTTVMALEEDELLASFDEEILDLPTDFPTNRPLRHFVRPKNMSLYLAMNKQRTSENYNSGQLCDAMIALEKYHSFGFGYSDVKVPVSAVWGDKDTLIPQRAINILANSLPDLRLKILEGEGHDLVWKEGVMEWAMRGIHERWK